MKMLICLILFIAAGMWSAASALTGLCKKGNNRKNVDALIVGVLLILLGAIPIVPYLMGNERGCFKLFSIALGCFSCSSFSS